MFCFIVPLVGGKIPLFEGIIALFFFKALSFGEGLGGVGAIAPMFDSIVALFFFKALSFGEGLGGVGVIAQMFDSIVASVGGNDCLCSIGIRNI